MININNIFDNTTDDKINNNSLYYIKKQIIGNSLLNLAINEDNKIIRYSNEWLSLIKIYYPNSGMYYNIVDLYNLIINNNNITYIDKEVIPFVTSFSYGTVHGYCGLFYILLEYINNKDKYENYDIIVYKDSQRGLLDIIDYLCDKNYIDRNKIIYVDGDIIYKFKSIHIISNDIHNYGNDDITKNISNFINNIWNNDKIGNKKVSIIKSSNSVNITSSGIINYYFVNNFNNKYNITYLEPGLINEIEVINKINNCEIFVTTWGTAFFKNLVYISDKCKYIIVLVINDSWDFMTQYDSYVKNNNLINNFRNAKILYNVIDNNLNVNNQTIENILNE